MSLGLTDYLALLKSAGRFENSLRSNSRSLRYCVAPLTSNSYFGSFCGAQLRGQWGFNKLAPHGATKAGSLGLGFFILN